jgi:hypothetical protein
MVADNEARCLEDAQGTGEIEIRDDLIGNAGCAHVAAQPIDVQAHTFRRGEDGVLVSRTAVCHERFVKLPIFVLASRGE